MANVTEISQFDEGIYQLETTDVIEGGPLGVDNYQAKGLANRTRWLYNNLIKLIPKNTGYITGLDLGSTTGNISRSGDFTSAVVSSPSSGNSIITINLANSMGNTNYEVRSTIQSLSTNMNADNDVSKGVFKPISATQFQIAFREIDGENQNLRVHMRVYSL